MKKTLRKIAYGVLGLALLMGALWVRPKLFDDELCFVPQKPVDWRVNHAHVDRLMKAWGQIGHLGSAEPAAPVVTPELDACIRECLANPTSRYDVVPVIRVLLTVAQKGGTVPEVFLDSGMLRSALAKGYRNELYLAIAYMDGDGASFSEYNGESLSGSYYAERPEHLISGLVDFAKLRTLEGISFMPNRTYNLQWRLIERFEKDPPGGGAEGRRILENPSWANFYGESEAMQDLGLAYWGERAFGMIDELCAKRQAAPKAPGGPPPGGTIPPKADAKAAPVASE